MGLFQGVGSLFLDHLELFQGTLVGYFCLFRGVGGLFLGLLGPLQGTGGYFRPIEGFEDYFRAFQGYLAQWNPIIGPPQVRGVFQVHPGV